MDLAIPLVAQDQAAEAWDLQRQPRLLPRHVRHAEHGANALYFTLWFIASDHHF